jgi:hypothetical protein
MKCLAKKINIHSPVIDAHGLKIQEGRYLKFLPKSLGGGGGVARVSGKIARGWGSTYFAFYNFIAVLLTSFSKICLGGAVSYSPPPYPPVCIYVTGVDLITGTVIW